MSQKYEWNANSHLQGARNCQTHHPTILAYKSIKKERDKNSTSDVYYRKYTAYRIIKITRVACFKHDSSWSY